MPPLCGSCRGVNVHAQDTLSRGRRRSAFIAALLDGATRRLDRGFSGPVSFPAHWREGIRAVGGPDGGPEKSLNSSYALLRSMYLTTNLILVAATLSLSHEECLMGAEA